MSDHKENKTLPVALLVTGIVCIMILSCCFVWLIVRCERWRRRRKYRPKGSNRYSINASHMANGQELKDLAPRHLKPSANLIHYSSKHSVTSQSIPSLLSVDDSIASEPLYTGRNYGEDEPDSTGYGHLPAHELSIARILGSFPELPYYQSASNTSSVENVRDAKVRPAVASTSASSNIPIPRPRSSVTMTAAHSQSRDFGVNRSPLTDYANQASVESVTKSQSSAESLKLEIPGGTIRIRDMADVFQFTKLRGKKDKAFSVSTPNVSAVSDKPKLSAPTFETEV